MNTPGFRTREITLVTTRLDALRWLSAPGTGMLLEALMSIPVRPHRVEPRVRQRRPKSFPLMITPRHELRQQLRQQERGS